MALYGGEKAPGQPLVLRVLQEANAARGGAAEWPVADLAKRASQILAARKYLVQNAGAALKGPLTRKSLVQRRQEKGRTNVWSLTEEARAAACCAPQQPYLDSARARAAADARPPRRPPRVARRARNWPLEMRGWRRTRQRTARMASAQCPRCAPAARSRWRASLSAAAPRAPQRARPWLRRKAALRLRPSDGGVMGARGSVHATALFRGGGSGAKLQ